MTAPDAETELCDLVDRLMKDGTLPSITPSRVWAGHGEGHACVACGRPIAHADVEYELLFTGNPHDRTVRLHRACYSAWQTRMPAGPSP